MTNDRVFGAALHMDIYLRKIRNIMKNFANFALLAFLLGTIIKDLIGGSEIKAKELVTKTLVAGILIQASWFMMGALIDVSTVAVSAIGSFPASFMQSDVKINESMTKAIDKMKTSKLTIDNQMKVTSTNTNTSSTPNTTSNEDILASIMPDANSMGGPLIFLGLSVFRFYEYTDQTATNTTTGTVVGFSLKMLVLLIFTVAMLLLLIANIVRVAFLRIFIIASPFVVLLKAFGKEEILGKS